MTRLQSKRSGFLFNMKNLVGQIHAMFNEGEFEKDGRLSGLYLLGYHCQRLDLIYKAPIDEPEKESEGDIIN